MKIPENIFHTKSTGCVVLILPLTWIVIARQNAETGVVTELECMATYLYVLVDGRCACPSDPHSYIKGNYNGQKHLEYQCHFTSVYRHQ